MLSGDVSSDEDLNDFIIFKAKRMIMWGRGRAGLVHRVRAWCMQGVDNVETGRGRAGAPGESLVHAG